MATTHHSAIAPPNDSDAHLLRSESSAYASLRRNVIYLSNPSSPNAPRPTRFRTRAFLRATHYLLVFVFWRLVRWAKYALVGSAVAALGSVAVAGSLATGVGWLVAPPGIAASLVVGVGWGVGRAVWRRVWRKGAEKRGEVVAVDETYAVEPEVDAVPW